jgi:hypothetical protein
LKKYFDSFVAMYGIIVSLDQFISKIIISGDGSTINYVAELNNGACINQQALNYYNGATMSIYNEMYQLSAYCTGNRLTLTLTKL